MLRYWLRYVPLMRSLLAFLIGVFSADFVFVTPLLTLGFGLLVLISILYFFRHPSFRYGWIPGALIVSIFFLFGNAYTSIRSVQPCCKADHEVDVSGYVIDRIGFTAKSQKVEFFADTIFYGDTLLFNQKGVVFLSNDTDAPPLAGQSMAFRLRLMSFEEPDNPGMFNYPKYLLRHGFSFMGYADAQSLSVKPVVRWSPKVQVAQLKDALVTLFLNQGVEADHIGLLQSFFLGDKSELDPGVKRAFMNSGTMHLLAVSGMHVGIIYLLLLYLFPSFGKNGWRIIRFLVILASLWLYGTLTGLSPSVLRAIIMMSVLEIGRTFQRETSILNLLVVAFFLILLIDPFSVYSAGLWLSFSAVAGIVFVYPILNQLFVFRFPAFQWLWSLIAVSVAAQVGTLPFSLFYFHAFPVYFLLNNLILVPLLAPVLFLALLVLFFSPIPFLSAIFAGVLNDLLLLIGRYVVFAEQLPHSVLKYIAFDGFDLVMTLMLLGLLYLFLNQRICKTILYGLVVLVLFLIKLLAYNQFLARRSELVVFDVPSKLMMVVATPLQTLVFVSENVSDADIGYVASGYLSQAGMKPPEVIPVNRSLVLDIDGFLVGVVVDRHSWSESEKMLAQAEIVVVASEAWPPDDWVQFDPHLVVLSSGLKPALRKRWSRLSGKEGFRLFDVIADGGIVLNPRR